MFLPVQDWGPVDFPMSPADSSWVHLLFSAMTQCAGEEDLIIQGLTLNI